MNARCDTVFPLAYAALYALAALVVHALYFPIGDIGVETDFYGELAISAQKLWSGEFSVTNYPYKGPFYSFAIQPIYAVVQIFGGGWHLSGVVLNLLCAGASLVVLYRLLLGYFGRRPAIWATVSASLVFEFFNHTHKASSDLLFLLLFLLVISVLTRPGLGWKRLILAGILSGLAFLTRYNGLILPVAAAGCLLVVGPERWPLRRRLGATGVVVGIFVATVAPWYVANLSETGNLLSTRHLQNIFVEEFYGGEHAAMMPEERLVSLPAIVMHDPAHFAKLYLGNLPKHLRLDMRHMLGTVPAILFLLGLLRGFFVPPTRRQWCFWIFPIAYFLAMGLVYHQPRFSLPLIGAYSACGMLLLFGSGSQQLSRPGRWLQQRWRHACDLLLPDGEPSDRLLEHGRSSPQSYFC